MVIRFGTGLLWSLGTRGRHESRITARQRFALRKSLNGVGRRGMRLRTRETGARWKLILLGCVRMEPPVEEIRIEWVRDLWQTRRSATADRVCSARCHAGSLGHGRRGT